MVPINTESLQETPPSPLRRGAAVAGQDPGMANESSRFRCSIVVIACRGRAEASAGARRWSTGSNLVAYSRRSGNVRYSSIHWRGLGIRDYRDLAVHLFHFRCNVAVGDCSLVLVMKRMPLARENAGDRDVFLCDAGVGRQVCVRVWKAGVPVYRGRSALTLDSKGTQKLTSAEGLWKARIPIPSPQGRGPLAASDGHGVGTAGVEEVQALGAAMPAYSV